MLSISFFNRTLDLAAKLPINCIAVRWDSAERKIRLHAKHFVTG